MNLVTGAFGFIGKYIARLLLERGEAVRTVTTHPDKPDPFGGAVEAFSYAFDRPDELTRRLEGCRTLFNTYWIRYAYGGMTFGVAVENTRVLMDCAREAGVERVVQISVTNASEEAALPYFRFKGTQDRLVRESGLGWSIVKPTLVFGLENSLVNNIAWLLRRFPVFPIFGDGRYRVQPVYVEDLAEIAAALRDAPNGTEVDAIGPETFAFGDFVNLFKDTLGARSFLFHSPPALGLAAGRLIGFFKGDVLLTENELQALMDEFLISDQAPNAAARFSEWLAENHAKLGTGYTSEVKRHFRRPQPG